MVLAGASLVMVGLLAYSIIPNVHTVPIQSTQAVLGSVRTVYPDSLYETHKNITIMSGENNVLLVNMTVSLQSGSPSSLQFKLSTGREAGNCIQSTNPSGCLVNTNVSNQTISVPLNSSATYYFAFENGDSSNSKVVHFSASLFASSVNTLIARDGELNFVALGLSAVGLFVALYGVAAKTVIPWE